MTRSLPPNTRDLAIYVHWPFCRSKCPYCDFNSHVAAGIEQTVWARSYLQALRHYAALLPDRRITSIFFGGGTPSLMDPVTVAAVIDAITGHWPLAPAVEITLEANPTSVEAARFRDFRTAGVNRLSLGVQSLVDADLRFLGREHDAAAARQAIDLAARSFPRFSFDLIYGRQGQTLPAWETELTGALVLAGDHLSLYQLTMEPGTQFHTRHQRGEVLTAPDEATVRMYERTQEIMRAAGRPAYEISNHAKPGEESRHNLTYWHYEDYIGIGPGAHGRFQLHGQRLATEDHRAPDVWLRQVAAHHHGLRVRDLIDQPTAMREALMMGLRLASGIGHAVWQEKFGLPLADFLPQARLQRLIGEGYILNDDHALQATAAGRQRLNAVLRYLLN